MGRLFAYGSLAQSGRLVQETAYESGHVKDFTSAVISLATKKRYLQEPAAVIIHQLCEKVLQNLMDGTAFVSFKAYYFDN